MVILVSILVLLSLFVWYGSLGPDPDVNRYPGDEELVHDPGRYVGHEVAVGGKVVSVSPLVMEVEYGGDTREIQVTGVDDEPKVGDRLTVFGILVDEHTIDSSKHVVQPLANIVYMYAVSFAAVGWVVYRIYKEFSWDRKNKIFEPEGPHG